MKTLGLLGGMSWESTAVYYRFLNQLVRERMGGLHSCSIILNSLDFSEIEACQANGDWKQAGQILIAAAQQLERAGAKALVICTNTMHKLAGEIESAINMPLIHIADATAIEIKKRDLKRPLLLATRYTMEQDFYKGRLLEKHGINVVIPDEDARVIVHNAIYQELCKGVISAESKKQFLDIIVAAIANGIDCVILGCTEIGMLIQQSDVAIPVLDTTLLHAEAAVDFALSETVDGKSVRKQAEFA